MQEGRQRSHRGKFSSDFSLVGGLHKLVQSDRPDQAATAPIWNPGSEARFDLKSRRAMLSVDGTVQKQPGHV